MKEKHDDQGTSKQTSGQDFMVISQYNDISSQEAKEDQELYDILERV